MKIVKIYLLILIFALPIIGVSCSSRFTPRKNDINNCEKANENKPSTNIFERVAGATYSGNGHENIFSQDAKTITNIKNGKTNTYKYSNENNGIAVYYDDNGEVLRLDIQDGILYYIDMDDKRVRMDIL